MKGVLASRTVLAPRAARVSKTCLPPVNRDGTDKKAPPNCPNPPGIIRLRGVLLAPKGDAHDYSESKTRGSARAGARSRS
jgi:hypothetical protein